MPQVDIENANIKSLADRLIDDIRRRGLRPGDRYMTASEACRDFDVSQISAHRAMQLLADRDLLVRQRGSGTFVGRKLDAHLPAECPLRVVHVVMSMDYQRTATVPAETLVDRLGVSMPEAVIEVHYVTAADAMRHLDRIVERIDSADKTSEGIILIRSTRKMQLYVQESGLPAAVFGGVYSGVTRLPWVDVDQDAVGRTMAQYVIGGKHKPKRLALLMRDDWRRGDNLMFGGVTAELGAAGVAVDALRVLSIPPERHHIAEEVHALLEADADITGIMCRTHLYAEVAAEVVRSLGKERAARVRIVAGGGRRPLRMPYAYVLPRVTEEDQVEMVGRILFERALDPKAQVATRVIPVDLVNEK